MILFFRLHLLLGESLGPGLDPLAFGPAVLFTPMAGGLLTPMTGLFTFLRVRARPATTVHPVSGPGVTSVSTLVSSCLSCALLPLAPVSFSPTAGGKVSIQKRRR